MTATPRGLLLDIGGVVLAAGSVLVNRWATRDARVAAVVEPLGGIAGPRDDPWRRMLAGEISERAYWAQRAGELAAAIDWVVGESREDGGVGEVGGVGGVGEVGDTRALISSLFAGPRDEWLQEDVVQLMRDARAAGIPVGALTNDLAAFHGQQWVDDQEWLRLFDVVVDASRTGVFKPDPAAFASGAAALGRAPHDIVYLDDMPWNVAGGRRAGLQAIAVEHGNPGPAVAQARQLLGLHPAALP